MQHVNKFKRETQIEVSVLKVIALPYDGFELLWLFYYSPEGMKSAEEALGNLPNTIDVEILKQSQNDSIWKIPNDLGWGNLLQKWLPKPSFALSKTLWKVNDKRFWENLSSPKNRT